MLLGYKKDRLQLLFVISMMWLLFGAISLVSSSLEGKVSLTLPFIYILQAVLFYMAYRYCKIKKYVHISKEFIQCNSFSKPKAYINEIKKVKKNGNTYFLYTPKKTLRINTKLLDTNAIKLLEDFLIALPNSVIV